MTVMRLDDFPRRADSRRTVERILEVSTRTLGRHANASMERIAAAADVHRATLYRHFPTRDALVQRLAENAIRDARTLVEAVSQLPSEAASVRRLATDTVAFGDRYVFLIGTDAIT